MRKFVTFTLFLSLLLTAAPVFAGEIVAYPGVVLQTINGANNCLAPSGVGDKSTSLSGNSVTLNSGTVSHAFGAVNSDSADTDGVSGNKVFINGGIAGTVYGGRGDFGYARGNSVTMSGGTVEYIYGGFSIGDASSLIPSNNATGNTVSINGGTVKCNVEGGRTNYGLATGNTVDINGNPTFETGVEILGGFSTEECISGNTLKLNIPITVGSVSNFENYEFRVAASVVNGSSILTVANPVALAGVSIDITSISSASTLAPGNKITLFSKVTGKPAKVNDNPYVEGASISTSVGKWKFNVEAGKLTATLVSLSSSSGGGGGCSAGYILFTLVLLFPFVFKNRK
jgi:hypothetical protein